MRGVCVCKGRWSEPRRRGKEHSPCPCPGLGSLGMAWENNSTKSRQHKNLSCCPACGEVGVGTLSVPNCPTCPASMYFINETHEKGKLGRMPYAARSYRGKQKQVPCVHVPCRGRQRVGRPGGGTAGAICVGDVMVGTLEWLAMLSPLKGGMRQAVGMPCPCPMPMSCPSMSEAGVMSQSINLKSLNTREKGHGSCPCPCPCPVLHVPVPLSQHGHGEGHT